MFANNFLNVAFDGVRAHDLADVCVPDNARHAAVEYIQRVHPRCAAALLFGSFARGNFGAFSDIDLIIVDRGCSQPCLDLAVAEGFRIEAFSFSPKSLVEVLQIQAQQGVRVFASAIADGELLCGDATLVAQLKRQSKKITEQRVVLDVSDDVERSRIRLTYWIAKMEFIVDSFDGLYLASLILHLIMATWLLQQTGEVMSNELLPGAFRLQCPELSFELRASYIALAESGNAKLFQSTCLAIMSRIGGAQWSGVRLGIM